MKKILTVLIALSVFGTAEAVSVRPIYTPTTQAYNRGYNNGYRYGYSSGKSHERNVIAKKMIGTGLVVIGAVVIYNILTDKPVNKPVRTSVRF